MSREYTFSELRESKLIFDRKPPAFGVIITLITLAMVAGLLVLAGFAERTYVVKASSQLVSAERSNVMNGVSGAVKAIYVQEGQAVEKGELLFEIDDFQMQIQIEQLKTSYGFVKGKIDIFERLIGFVNGFTLSEPDTRVNPFYKGIADEAKAYADAQTFIDYIDGQEKPADTEPEEGEESESEENTAFTQSNVDSVKSQFLSSTYETYDGYRREAVESESKIKMYEEGLTEYGVRAATAGAVHFNAAITVGTVLQAGSLIGSISSGDKESLYFETVISAVDRSKINAGDYAEIAVSGVLQSEFGIVRGKVVSIDNDSTQTENGEVFYKLKIKPDYTELSDKKGNTVRLSVGMVAESRIKYDETTWLKWAIEQIGIKFR
ncbi:MAG: HlyD family secretion protein [Clostridiaceae bacterium]|jgi:multidrug resistance efflux pump|nr:HlyD family secretion protein [Clostridiaceae bacterium]